MKKVFKFVALSLLVLTVSACSSTVVPGGTTTIDLPTVTPNLPEPPTLATVTWHVYDANDLKAAIAANPNIILFTLTQDQNKALDDNLVELQRYILQLKQTVVYYQNLNSPAKN